MPNISPRRWLLATLTAVVLGGWISGGVPGLPAADAQTKASASKGEVTVESLGNLLSAIGVEAKKTESRYDFAFAAKVGKGEDDKEAEEWQLSMSVVLSDDQKSIWIMAWLNELPKSAQDVPRTALLRLLADNDKLGNGQFFAYIASNRRFVLQRVVPNERITTAAFREMLVELGRTVTEYHADWSVANWKAPTTGDAQPAGATSDSGKQVVPAATSSAAGAAPKSAASSTSRTTTRSPAASTTGAANSKAGTVRK